MGTVRGFGLNFTAMSAEVAEQPSGPPARQVVYCGVCSLPPEYCEFGGTVKKCEEWLLKHHPDMHQKLYSAEALSANLSALSVEAQKRAEKDAAKKTAKELGKKFATGSSVTKTASGGEEITVQGDVSDDLYDWLTEKYPEIPEDNIDMKDETKKKSAS